MKRLFNALITFSLLLILIGCTYSSKKTSSYDFNSIPEKLLPAGKKIPPEELEKAQHIKKRLKQIPLNAERKFNMVFVNYLLTGHPPTGQKLILKLKNLVQSKDQKISSPWVDIFETKTKFKRLNSGLGEFTHNGLLQLLQFGDPTAIEFLMIYSASVQMNTLDYRYLKGYSRFIKKNYRSILKESILKNEVFLLDYPQEI